MANFEDIPAIGLPDSRKLVPLALIAAGLILAIIGAGQLASPAESTVTVSTGHGVEVTQSTIPGSPWGFVIVGGVVFLVGCTLQVLAWRSLARTADAQVASHPAPARAAGRDLGREQQSAPQLG